MYIQSLKIYKFRKKADFTLSLSPSLTLLSGHNGSGKTAALSLLEAAMGQQAASEQLAELCEGVTLQLSNHSTVSWQPKTGKAEYRGILPEDFKQLVFSSLQAPDNYDISDTAFAKAASQILNKKLQKGIDQKLLHLVQQFTHYKSVSDAQAIEKIRRNEYYGLAEQHRYLDAFYNILDDYFKDVNKRLDRDALPFCFLPSGGNEMWLSTGEKQLLIIFLTVFLQYEMPSFLALDEALLNINTFWQKRILKDIHTINPRCQILVATHSPYTLGEQLGNARIKIDDCWNSNEKNTVSSKFTAVYTHIPTPKISSDNVIQTHQSTLSRIARLRSDFVKIQENKEYRDFDRTYQVNLRIKEELSFSLEECQEIVVVLNELKIGTDVITVTTLMNRMESLDECKSLLEVVSNPDDAVMYVEKVPNEITLNSMLKKAATLEEGLAFVEECEKHYPTMDAKFPDIITFSTLLGKANTRIEIDDVENMRRQYKVAINDIYITRLHSKREHLRA
ncbi:MAG: ATP-binding protein [Cytophagales bacterium]|nr:MAG: ATP-binding protein [Cytophagales bacterium]TAF62088.1 MAG: ATP-binding protein [Cytophagales bacterium]